MEVLAIETFIISIILVLLPIIDWTASIILHRAKNRAPNSIALFERARIAVVLSIASTINGLLGMNRLVGNILPQPVTILIISFSLFLVSMPNLYWLYLYRKSRIRRGS